MVRLTSPNGVEVQASDAAAPRLLALGFARAETKEQVEPPRKKAAKKKQ